LEVLALKWNLAKVRHVEVSQPPVLVMTDRKRLNKMMRIVISTEETWRLLANNSEGLLFLNLANSLLVILFCMRADCVLLVSRERILTQELSTLRMIKCDPA